MSKKNFISLIIGTVGGVLFALGMCMVMLPNWGMGSAGIIVGTAGLAVLLILVGVRRKMVGKPIIPPVSPKTLGKISFALVGTLTLGAGMCMVMLWDMLVWGIIVGLVGIILLLCLIPLVKGLY